MKTDDERAQRNQKQRDADARLEVDNDLRAVLSTVAGRRFMWRLIHDEVDSYSPDPVTTTYRATLRQVRIDLERACKRVSMATYVVMAQEHYARLEAMTPPPDGPVVEE